VADDPRFKALPAAEYRAQQFGAMSEEVFQARVEQLATQLGWSFYHTHNSRRSQPGYPDLHLWHPKYGQLFRELKTMKGKQSVKQLEVEASMRAAGVKVAVWRPADLDGLILEELRGNI
jgi:hypothetical protein